MEKVYVDNDVVAIAPLIFENCESRKNIFFIPVLVLRFEMLSLQEADHLIFMCQMDYFFGK